MEVRKNCVVAIEYTVKDETGAVVAKSGNAPTYYLHGHNNILPGLEQALTGRQPGDSVQGTLAPDQGFGIRDEKLVFDLPKAELKEAENLKKGMRLRLQVQEGTRTVLVTKVKVDTIQVDANHDLAGRTLHFSATVRQVRDATREELSHGHAHGPGHRHH